MGTNLYREWVETAYHINACISGLQTLTVNGTFVAKFKFLQSSSKIKMYPFGAKNEIKVFKTSFCLKYKIFTAYNKIKFYYQLIYSEDKLSTNYAQRC
jgi:hypothetical protein